MISWQPVAEADRRGTHFGDPEVMRGTDKVCRKLGFTFRGYDVPGNIEYREERRIRLT